MRASPQLRSSALLLSSFGLIVASCGRRAGGNASAGGSSPSASQSSGGVELVASADVPPAPHPSPNLTARYAPEADGIRDTATDLLWQKSTSDKPISLAAARAFCASQPAGFRVPTRIELVTLANLLASRPAMDSSFGAAPSAAFWSITPVAGEPDARWTLDFTEGVASPSRVDAAYVRCVRGTMGVMPSPRFASLGEAVRDATTGFTWTNKLLPEAFDFEGAREACKHVKIGSLHTFHLPARQELETIVDTSLHSPAIDVAAFPGATGDVIWSATEVASRAGEAWVVSYERGEARPASKIERHGVRCVKTR